jgi:hypothetical protein
VDEPGTAGPPPAAYFAFPCEVAMAMPMASTTTMTSVATRCLGDRNGQPHSRR